MTTAITSKLKHDVSTHKQSKMTDASCGTAEAALVGRKRRRKLVKQIVTREELPCQERKRFQGANGNNYRNWQCNAHFMEWPTKREKKRGKREKKEKKKKNEKIKPK
jgi:uncharacterized membrane protein YebE (DUF533 family)